MVNFSKENNPEINDKPKVLFIGTQTRNLSQISPREGRHRGANEGPVIFATPDKALASIFLIDGHNDDWMEIGYFDDVPYTVICMERKKFLERDRGGVIYEVPSETFNYNPDLGMREKEWTSKSPVKPNQETNFPSALDEMIKNGVYVFFVDERTLRSIKDSDDHGFEIISSLVSENELRDPDILNFKQSVKN